jgi:NTE family protein
MYKIGISLSGGGTRGVVHIGVLKALEENQIYPEVIAGTSAGSIIGAMYAHGYSPEEMFAISTEQSLIRMFSLRLPRKGFVRHSFLRKMLRKYIPEKTFEELSKPLFVAISNLNTGEAEIRHTGTLHEVIVASASIPVLFEPIQIENHWYADGGLLMNLPASPIRSLASYIIGVNLIPRKELSESEVNTISGVASRTFNLAAINTVKPELPYCDVIIEPEAILKYSRFNFTNIREMHDIGYEETLKLVPRMKDEINSLASSISMQ